MAKKKRSTGPIVVALVFLPVAAIAFWFFYDSDEKQEAPKKSVEVVARDAGSVNVLVTAGGVPLANASVLALSFGTRRPAVQRTDEQGQAELTGLAPGEITIGVRAKGFEPGRRKVMIEVDAEQNVEIELQPRVEKESPEAAPTASPSADDLRVEPDGSEKD